MIRQLVVDIAPGTEIDVVVGATVTFDYRIRSTFECCDSVVVTITDAAGPIVSAVDVYGIFTDADVDALVAEAFAAFDGRRVGPACSGPNDGQAYSLELAIDGDTVTVGDAEVVDVGRHRVLVDLARVFAPPETSAAHVFRAAAVRMPTR